MSGPEDVDGFHESKSARMDAADGSSGSWRVEDARGSEAVETQAFIYGNYPSYYGYRNRGRPSTGLDPRLCAVLRRTCADLFSGKRIVDIGCNSGLVTLQIGMSHTHFRRVL